MTDLLECRKEIDVIDKEILRLFEKRMKVCEDVARYIQEKRFWIQNASRTK